MASFSAIGEYFAGFVHHSAAADEVAAARHRSFILAHLTGGIIAFTVFPLALLLRGGAPSAAEIAVLAWLVLPILTALDLARTGNLERAHFLSAASLAGIIVAVAGVSGGLSSFALIWLPLLSFEAALSGSRRVIFASLGAGALAIVLLLGLHAAGLPGATAPSSVSLNYLSALGALLYATGLALRWDSVQRAMARVRISNNAHYELLAGSMSDLITRHAPSGAVMFASPAASKVIGTGANELLGRGLFERVHVADRPAYLTALNKAGQGVASSAEIRMRKDVIDAPYGAPPSFVHVDMNCRPSDKLDEVGHVLTVTRIAAERSVAPAVPATAGDSAPPVPVRRDIDTAEAAKGRFLASMSHELRTPLNAIIGFSELLAHEELGKVDEKRRLEYARLIHESGLHLLSVVNAILDMSRIDSGNFSIVAEPFSFRPVVSSCLQLFALKADKAAVRLVADIPEGLPDLVADKRACKQILINLLSNAIKFTAAGGEVRISAHEEQTSVRIEVADTGVGISAEDLPHIGNSFFQARSSYDRPYEGTGLGLSVVKGLIGLHDGGFDVKSEIGKGTCVIVRLPRDRGDIRTSPATQILPPQRERRAAIG
ncbi:PAS domain-containing sensor histidine kinase [Terrihabitans soli]|nr:PAS domain-containing sensor histidine kinase [Terrihabitans soli]